MPENPKPRKYWCVAVDAVLTRWHFPIKVPKGTNVKKAALAFITPIAFGKVVDLEYTEAT